MYIHIRVRVRACVCTCTYELYAISFALRHEAYYARGFLPGNPPSANTASINPGESSGPKWHSIVESRLMLFPALNVHSTHHRIPLSPYLAVIATCENSTGSFIIINWYV